MSYELKLSDEAIAALKSFSPFVRVRVVEHLRRLAEDPVKLSRRAGHPHPQDGQEYSFRISDGATTHWITVNFHYWQERRIDVAWIVHISAEL